MRKVIVLLAAILTLAGCTGCGSELNVTTEQNELLAEYTAGILLKYSNEYKYQYSKLNNKIEQPTQAPTSPLQPESETAVNSKPSEGESETATQAPNALTAIGNALGDGIKVKYNKYVICDEYPVGGLVTVKAPTDLSPAKKLFVVEFILENNTEQEILCNARGKDIIIGITINGGREVSQMQTLLFNDVQVMKDFSVGAGKQELGIAAFMVSETELASIKEFELFVYVNQEKKGSVVVK